MKKLIIAALLLTSAISHANTPTEVVVLFPPGGVNDIVGRAVTESFKRNNLNTITVNKPGADGIIGIDYALKNKTDSLVVANAGSLVFNRITKKTVPYDVDRDFNLVVPIAMVPSSIVVSIKSGITNMDQFIKAAQTRQLNCGLTNQGTTLAFRAALKQLGIEKNVAIIPYKGTSQVTVDLLSGQLDCIMEPISSFVQHHNTNKAIIIANTSDRAYEQMPQIPLLSKWIPGFKFESWFGIAIPKTIKSDKQKQYTEVLNRLSADFDYVTTINNAGMMVVRPSVDPKKYVNDEYKKWEAVRQNLGIEKVD